jgi:hypothetical protein
VEIIVAIILINALAIAAALSANPVLVSVGKGALAFGIVLILITAGVRMLPERH